MRGPSLRVQHEFSVEIFSDILIEIYDALDIDLRHQKPIGQEGTCKENADDGLDEGVAPPVVGIA